MSATNLLDALSSSQQDMGEGLRNKETEKEKQRKKIQQDEQMQCDSPKEQERAKKQEKEKEKAINDRKTGAKKNSYENAEANSTDDEQNENIENFNPNTANKTARVGELSYLFHNII